MRNAVITIAALPDHPARSWRCANRVEHGKKFCQHSPSISEDRIKEVLCEKLGLSAFDGDEIKNKVDVILQIELQCQEYFEMLPN